MRNTKFESNLIFIINLENNRLKLVFDYNITFLICGLVFLIHKGYFIVKTINQILSNTFIKAFLNAKINALMFLIKKRKIPYINVHYFTVYDKL